MKLLLALVLLAVMVSFYVADGDQVSQSSSLKYRTWKRAVKECATDRCFLPWTRHRQYSPFPETFVDYNKGIRDGYLLACPASYTLAEALELDPFRMCYTDSAMSMMNPNACWTSMVSTFGYSQQSFCTPKDPCFEDHRLALRVTNVSLMGVTPFHNGTMISHEAIDLFGLNIFFSVYSGDEVRSACTIADGFRSFDLTLQLILPTQIEQDIVEYVNVEYNITILTTCTVSDVNCTGSDLDFSSSNNTVEVRQLSFADFDSLLSDNSQDEACIPFRTPFGIRALLCIEHEYQQTLFSPPKPLITTAEEFEAVIQELKQTQQRNIKLFLW